MIFHKKIINIAAVFFIGALLGLSSAYLINTANRNNKSVTLPIGSNTTATTKQLEGQQQSNAIVTTANIKNISGPRSKSKQSNINVSDSAVEEDVYKVLFSIDQNTDYVKELALLTPEKLTSINMDEDLAVQVLLTLWAEVDPSRAWQWIKENPSKVENNSAEFKVLFHYLLQQPLQAGSILQEMPIGFYSVRQRVIEASVNHLLVNDAESLNFWHDHFSSPDIRGQVAFTVAHILTGESPQKGLDYLQQQQYELPQEALISSGEAIGKKLAFSSITDSSSIDHTLKLLGNYDSTIRDAAIIGLASTLTSHNIRAVTHLITEVSDRDVKNKLIEAAVTNNTTNFDIVIGLVNQLDDPRYQNRILSTIVSTWLNNSDTYSKHDVIDNIKNLKSLTGNQKTVFITALAKVD